MKPIKWAAEIHAWADGSDIEVSWIGNEDKWVDVNDPKWSNCDYLYRVKPKTITRTITYPKPLKTLVEGQVFWWASGTCQPQFFSYYSVLWQNELLKNGMCFATEEDAIACHEALFGKHV